VTAEGTIKKGLGRIIGTLLGGFAAWVGIMLCSLSYNGTDPVNPFGLVAYLTVVFLLATCISLERGPLALFGMGYDLGYISSYCTAVLLLISLEAYRGDKGSINDLVLNRIVATITGVVVAMLIACVPPKIEGRDPRLLCDYCDFLHATLLSLMKLLAKERKPIDREDFEAGFSSQADYKRRAASFVLKDSGKMHFVKHFRVPKSFGRIKNLLEVEHSNVSHSIETAAADFWNDSTKVNWDVLSPALEAAANGKGIVDANISRVLSSSDSRDMFAKIVLRSFIDSRDRLRAERAALDSIGQKNPESGDKPTSVDAVPDGVQGQS